MSFKMIDKNGSDLGKVGVYTGVGKIRTGDVVIITMNNRPDKVVVDVVTSISGKPFIGELKRSLGSISSDDNLNTFLLIPNNEVTDELITRFSSIEGLRKVEIIEKEMTLADIERELGYNIKLVD